MKFKKVLKSIDLFGAPINLNIDGKTTYKSSFGGTLTLVMIALLILLCQSSILTYANKENIFVDVESIFSQDAPPVELNQDNFMFAVAVQQPEEYPFNMRPFYSVEVQQVTIDNVNDSLEVFTMQLQACDYEQFKLLQQQDPEGFQRIFNKNNLTQYLCPPRNFSLNMSGVQLSSKYTYVTLDVTPCTNSTSSINCAPTTVREEYSNQHGGFMFQMFTSNFVLNPEKNQNISQIYLSDDLSQFFQPEQLTSQVNVIFSEYLVDTDNSLFIDQDLTHQQYVVRDETSVTVQTLREPKKTKPKPIYDEERTPIRYLFRSDHFSTRAKRKFTKIDELISYIGGLFNSLLLLMGLIMRLYNQEYFRLHLANKLYEFKEVIQEANRVRYLSKQSKFEKMKQLMIKMQHQHDVDHHHHQDQLNTPQKSTGNRNAKHLFQQTKAKAKLSSLTSEQDLKAMGFNSRQEFIMWYLNDISTNKQTLSMGFSYLVYLLSCRRHNQSTMNKSVEKGLIRIGKDLNVKHIIHKLTQVDRLKELVLTQQQIILLNFLPKASISIQDREKIKLSHRRGSTVASQITSHLDPSSFKQLIQAFKNIETTKTTDETTLAINEKLFHFLGDELITILRVSLMLENIEQQDVFLSPSPKVEIQEEDIRIKSPVQQQQSQYKLHTNRRLPQPYPDMDLPIGCSIEHTI